MRLIDADAIPWDVDGVGFIPVIGKDEIDEMPTVDAKPVRHGRWIYPKESLWSLGKCSVCGTISVVATTANYCPMCGAKMDEDGEDGKE